MQYIKQLVEIITYTDIWSKMMSEVANLSSNLCQAKEKLLLHMAARMCIILLNYPANHLLEFEFCAHHN